MIQDSLTVLLIEDNPGDARLVMEALGHQPRQPVNIHHAETLGAAMPLLDDPAFDAVLLDLSLPDSHGMQTLHKVRERTALPIIVLTGAADDEAGLATLQDGAQDYLVKGEIPGSLLVRSIRYAIERMSTLEALRTTEQRYELAIAATRDGIWDWDLESDTIDYSQRWMTMLGYEPGELDSSPETWFSRIHHGDRGRVQRRLQEHLSGQLPTFFSEYRMQHRDGQIRWMLARGLAVADASGEYRRLVGSQTDITDRKQAELRLQRAAYRDPLTGLDNRTQMKLGLEQALAASARRTTGIGVLFLDLDNFKSINDTLGHSAGDHVLCVIARRLTVELREYDRIARFGGDEFMILIDDLEGVEQAERIARRVLDAIIRPIRLGDREATLSASIGITTCMNGETDPEYLLQSADVAMYQAKSNGKNGIAVFEPAMMSSLVERMELEHVLRRALDNRTIALHYQPIVDLATSRIIGIEALARLPNDDSGWVSPAQFIPMAESAGLMFALGETVAEKALIDTLRMQELQPDLNLSINVSAIQLQHEDFVKSLFRLLDRSGFEPDRLTLEITETAVMTDTLAVIERLREIKCRGISIAIDDFGTGHSSLSVLRELPVDVLKIDRTFTSRMDVDSDGLEIVRLITVMARALRLSVIAEGIETKAQLNALQKLGCHLGQGYLISHPVALEAIEDMIADQEPEDTHRPVDCIPITKPLAVQIQGD